jgi:hypothetical protein
MKAQNGDTWLESKHGRADLQVELDAYRKIYIVDRPHRTLIGATPRQLC